jgi:hypothetical protein
MTYKLVLAHLEFIRTSDVEATADEPEMFAIVLYVDEGTLLLLDLLLHCFHPLAHLRRQSSGDGRHAGRFLKLSSIRAD